MKTLITENIQAQYSYSCDSCGYEITDTNDVCETMSLSFGWPHWADTQDLLFCGDQCLINFIQIGMAKFGAYQAQLGEKKCEPHFLVTYKK